MNRLLIVVILTIGTLPLYGQGQQPNTAELAQKVVGIIAGDKTKTQTYCQVLVGQSLGPKIVIVIAPAAISCCGSEFAGLSALRDSPRPCRSSSTELQSPPLLSGET